MNIYQFLILNAIEKNISLTFKELKKLGGFTDGNLASHLRALENLGFIKAKKMVRPHKYSISYYTTKAKGKKFLYEVLDIIKNGEVK